MRKPDPCLLRATRRPSKNQIARDRSVSGPGKLPNIGPDQQDRGVRASDRRLLLISRPGLVGDCLIKALRECGYDTVLHSLGDPLQAVLEGIKLIVIFMNADEPDGVAAARQRAYEVRDLLAGVPAMALIEHSDREVPHELVDAGLVAIVQGYLSVKLALAAINLVMAGGSHMITKIHLQAGQEEISRYQSPVGADVPDDSKFSIRGNFTKREIALLTHLRRGMQNKAIAYELGIAESTVKVHLRNIMSKLHASNRTQVAYMLANGPLAPKTVFQKLKPITLPRNVSELFPAAVEAKAKARTPSSTQLESQ